VASELPLAFGSLPCVESINPYVAPNKACAATILEFSERFYGIRALLVTTHVGCGFDCGSVHLFKPTTTRSNWFVRL
jgi:hypothetical protein